MIELTEEKVAALEEKLRHLPNYMKRGDEPLILALIAHWRSTQPTIVKICRYCHRVRSEHWGVNAHCDSDCLPTKTVFTPV